MKEEKKKWDYLMSPRFLADKMSEQIKYNQQTKIKTTILLLAKKERAKRKHFFRPGLWDREDKRENYYSLQRLLKIALEKEKEKIRIQN